MTAVLPVRNRERSLARAIDSVLAQSYPAVDLIVVDDGSTDGTPRILRSYGKDIRVLTQPPLGVYPARNLALRSTTADLVAFIDSDDAWRPDRLAQQVPLIVGREVGLVYGNALVHGSHRTTFDMTRPHRGRCADQLVWGNFVPTVTALVRRRALGQFSERAPLSADYLAWFRIASHHEIDYVEEIVADYTVHTGGISYDLTRALQTRIQLFTDELENADDPRTRSQLRRLLFNLAGHLALVSARGRRGDLRLAGRTMLGAGGRASPVWAGQLGLHLASARLRRLAG